MLLASDIYGSVSRDKLGVASGTIVTTSNTGRVAGTALGGALFSAILSYQGVKLTQGMDYSHWSANPTSFVTAFQQSFLIGAGLCFLSIFFSAVRGKKGST